jgi:hypothetical protein
MKSGSERSSLEVFEGAEDSESLMSSVKTKFISVLLYHALFALTQLLLN